MRRTLIVCLVLLGIVVVAHPVKEIDSNQKEVVAGFVNQAKEIPIPFNKCFRVEPQLQANNKYLNFLPTRLELNSLKRFSLKNQGSKITILQDLLSPMMYKHSNVLVFDNYLMVFFAPNTIIVIEQTSNGFQVSNRYKIANLGRFDKFKMYTLGKKGLLVVYDQKKAYLLGQTSYEQYQFPEASMIMHLTELNGEEFFAAQFAKGLAQYKLNPESKKVQLSQRITGEGLGLKDGFKYVLDVSLAFFKEGIILALDAQLGLVQLTLQNEITSKVIVSHKMCESFDTVERSHIVLLCQNQGHSTIIEVYRQYNRKAKQYQYRKLQPIFQANYLNDLHVSDSYYLVYSYKNIHVFWNTQKNRLPQTLQTQSQMVLPGLETFTFTRNQATSFLYTVEAGQLIKYRLEQTKAHLYVKSQDILTKTFKIFLYGSCQDVELTQNKMNKVQACKLSRNILMQMTQEQYSRQQDFGISASIIGIIVIVFLLVIWICLKKYKGLEQEARKVLKNYQNKRIKATREI